MLLTKKIIMKKITFFLFLLTVGVSSCSKEKEVEKDTIVNITLKDASGPLDNFSIYMFSSQNWQSFGNDKFFAERSVVTDENGLASFIINERTELDFSDAQTTLYFSVYYTVNGGSTTYTEYVGVTIQEDEEISKEIFIN